MTEERDPNQVPPESEEFATSSEPAAEAHSGAQSEAKPKRRLYRSRSERILGGVAGGVAEYFHVDPTLVRILWVAAGLLGIGVVAYVAAWFIVPERATGEKIGAGRSAARDRQLSWAFGLGLIVIGIYLLAHELGWYLPFHVGVDAEALGAVLLIGFGGYLLLQRKGSKETQDTSRAAEAQAAEAQQAHAQQAQAAYGQSSPLSDVRRLMRSRTDRKLAGVCGGLARHFDTDPSLIRVGFVIFACLTKLLGVLVYIALAIIVPEEPESVPSRHAPVDEPDGSTVPPAATAD